ncbi:MAG: T9SS type A sorting domain-containing protein [Flavobacteriaceae bacterium]|nr:T9SS type A sorting domain-containing protein [Flavobacteriaceae bacterium]
MKTNYILKLLLTILFSYNGQMILAQSVENFESESGGSATFTDAGQTFNIYSISGENYNVFSNGYNDNGGTDTCSGCGWNGTATDNKFIDKSGGANNNGSGFTITTSGAEEIGVTSLYLFCSTRSIAAHTGRLTITAKKAGITQYTFTKNSGFSNVVIFTPNNGFTFIDFATEGASDFTQIKIDELIITSTGNLDYMALDALSWAPGNTLSVNSFNLSSRVNIYPNPSADYIQISNITSIKKYAIYNILGKKVVSGEINQNQKINITKLNSGIYFIQLENGKATKFVKE